jgi:hypothetical protein
VSEPTTASTIAEKILGGEAPLPLRSAAARGALPLSRAVLARLHLHLLDDAEAQVREDAGASLSALGEPEIREIFSDPDCPPEVLKHLSPRAVRDNGLAELLVFHKTVPDAALLELAQNGNASVIELVLTNQERLLASPGLLDRLMTNPALRPDQRGRILDVLDRIVHDPAASEGAAGEESESGAEADVEEAARILDVDVGELYASSEILGGDELEQAEDPQVRDAYAKIVTLNVAQKAMLAIKGGHEERMILVRDSNRVVALCVLRNPRMNDQEVETIAKMRNVNDEVLRTIGTKREWIRSYAIVKSLIKNPKTPPSISTNFIPRLTNHDLKLLTRDKNVPEMIRKMAKRTHTLRTQRTAPRDRRKK